MVNWNKIIGNKNKVVQIFNFSIFGSKRKITNTFFKQIEQNIEDLDLINAEQTLESLKDNLDYFTKKQKYNFYFLTGKIKEYKNLYKEKIEDKTYFQNYKDAYQYLKNDKTKLNKAIGLYYLGNKEKSKKIVKELMAKEDISINLYGFHLLLKSEKYTDFNKFEKNIEKEYLNDSYIKWIVGNICKEKQDIVKAFEKYYLQDFNTIEKLTEKISYFGNWSSYLQKKYGIHNLPIEAKKEYLELDKFLDTFKNELEGKGLLVEIDIFNIKGIIYAEIKNNLDDSIYYFKRAIEKSNSAVIKLNSALSLILSNSIESKNQAIILISEIVQNFEEYLEAEKNNPNKDILYQAHIKLAELYGEKGQVIKGKSYLKVFKNNYLERVKKVYKRNFYITENNLIEDKKEKQRHIKKLLKEDGCVIYNLLSFKVFDNDKKYLDEAYNLYINNRKNAYNDIFIMADLYLIAGDKEKFFELMSKELRDLSKQYFFQNYIIIGIELGKNSEVENKIKEYKRNNGGKDDFISIRFESYLEEKKGDFEIAIDIIEQSDIKDENPELLIRKAYLELDIGDKESFKKTIEYLFNSYNTLDFSNKVGVIDLYKLIDRNKAIELVYDILKEDIKEEDYNIKLKQLYIQLLLPLKKGIFDTEKIDENSYIVIEENDSKEKKTFLLDGDSNINWADYILEKDDFKYKLLIGKGKGDVIENIFSGISGLDKTYNILEFQSKYIRLNNILYNKGEELGMDKINIPKGEEKAKFIEMGKKFGKEEKERKEYIKTNFYDKGLLSFGVLKSFYDRSYIDLYYSSFGDNFNLISDIHFKLNRGEIVDNIVIDISGILTLFELGIEDIIGKKFKIFISQSTLTFFNRELINLEYNWELQDNSSIIFNEEGGGQIITLDENYKDKRKEFLEKIINWLGEHSEKKSSNLLVSKDENLDLYFGKEFYDSLLIAIDNGYYLYSDDLVLRKYARNDGCNVKAFGIESLLIISNNHKYIKSIELFNYYHRLIELNISGLYITAGHISMNLIKYDEERLNLIFSYVKDKYSDFDFIIKSLFICIDKLINMEPPFKFDDTFINDNFQFLLNIILQHYSLVEVSQKYIEILETITKKYEKEKFKELYNLYILK